MLRVVRLGLYLTALLALWAALLAADLDNLHHQLVLFVSGRRQTPRRAFVCQFPLDHFCVDQVCLQAPVLAVLAFGAYAAVALLYGVLTFRTVPEEAESLAKVCKPAFLRSTAPAVVSGLCFAATQL
jgi:hypothetical protein